MQPRVARGVVDVDRAVGIGDPAVAEEHVRHVARAFAAHGGHEVSGRLGDDARRVVERRYVEVEHIAQSGGAHPHAVGHMEPAAGRLDRMGALAVLALLDRMVTAHVDDPLVAHLGAGHVVHQSPADATAATGVDEAVLRTGVERVFPLHELGMKHHVALLPRTLQVGQALPRLEIARAGDARGGYGGRQIAGCREVLAFGAEDAVDPAVLVGREAHVVDVRIGFFGFGHAHRIVAETEAVHAAGAFGHGEERLAVVALDTHHEQVFAVVADGSGIERPVDPEALHEVGIALGRKVVAPLDGRMQARQHRIFVTLIDAVPGQQRRVFADKEPVVLLADRTETVLEQSFCHIEFLSCISVCVSAGNPEVRRLPDGGNGPVRYPPRAARARSGHFTAIFFTKRRFQK